MWKVYQKGDLFRVARKNEFRGGLIFYMISQEEPRVYWDTLVKEVAFAKAQVLNIPVPILEWELVKEE